MNGGKKKKPVFDFSDLNSQDQEKEGKKPKKTAVLFDFSDMPQVKEPEVDRTEEILAQTYSPEQMKGAAGAGTIFARDFYRRMPLVDLVATPIKTIAEAQKPMPGSPIASGIKTGAGTLTGLGELAALPFAMADLAARQIPGGEYVADVAALPFKAVGELTQRALDPIKTIIESVQAPEKQKQDALTAFQGVSNLTQLVTQLMLGAKLFGGKHAKGEVAKAGEVLTERVKPADIIPAVEPEGGTALGRGEGVKETGKAQPEALPVKVQESIEVPPTPAPEGLRTAGELQEIPISFKKKMVKELGPDTMTRFGEVSKLSEADLARAYEEFTAKPKVSEKQPWEMTREQFQVENRTRLGIEAAFKIGNEVYKTGAIHDWSKVPAEIVQKAQRGGLPTESGFIDKGGEYFSLKGEPELRTGHHDLVKKALSEGKLVPPEVLEDYPDLAQKSAPKAGEEVQVGKPTNIPAESYQVKNTQEAVKLGEGFTQEQSQAVWDEYKQENAKALQAQDMKTAFQAQLLREQVEGYVAKQEGRPHEAMDAARIEKRLQRPITVDEKVAERPLHEIPTPVSDEIRAKADEVQGEIPGFSNELVGSKLVRTGEFPSESEVVGHLGGGQINTYPPWWGEVGANKQRIIEALEKIKIDKGKDKGVLVERLKKILHEELLFGAERGDAGQIPPSDIYGGMIDAWKGGKLDEFLSQKPAGEAVRFEKTKAGEQGVLISEQRTQEALGGIKSDIPLKEQVEGTMFEKKAEVPKEEELFEAEESGKFWGKTLSDPIRSDKEAIEVFDGATVSDAMRMPLETEAVTGFEATKVSSSAVISSIANIMKAAGRDVRIRTGRFRQKAEGVFKVKPEVIRLRASNNIPTAAHEAAHALQKILYSEVGSTAKALGGAPREVRAELFKLGRKLYGDSKPAGDYTSEGFAEFMRHYLTRDDAATVAPNMYRHFQEILAKNEKIAEAVAKAKETADAYRKEGAIQRAEANLDKGPTVTERLSKVWQTIREKTGYQMVDEFTPLQRLVEAAERRGVKLTPSEDPFKVASYLRGNAPATVHYMVYDGMLDFARNKVGPPLEEISSIVRGRKEDFTKYLWARRSQERLAKGMNPGMTKADADFIVAKLASPEFELAAQKVYDWNNGILRYVKEAVPDLAPSIEKIMSESDNYVPLQRALESERVPGEGGAGNALKKFKGSGLRVKDIFPQMIANAQQMISMAHKRKVLDSVIKLSDVEGMGRFVEEIPRDMVPVSKELSEIVRQLEKKGADVSGIEVDGLMTLFSPMKRPPSGGDPIIPAMKEGKLRWFQVDPELYRVLEGVDLYRLPKVADMFLAAPTRLFRLGTTGLRAAFSLVTNPARDVQTFIQQTRSEKNPAKLAAAWASAMAEAANPRRLWKQTDNFDVFYRLGVNMAQPLGADIGITRKVAKGLFKGKAVRIVSSPIEAVRELLSVTESAPRVAEISLIAEKIGWDKQSPLTFDQAVELGLAGKQVTVDFTAGGRAGKVINQMVPFFNANIQGTRSFARTLRDHPARASVRALTTITIPTLLLWWQHKDEEWYKDMPDREKFLYWHFPVGNEMLKIPRAFEWGNFFSVMPEAIFDSWYRKDPEGVKAAIGHIVETSNPADLPHVLQTVKEQWQNRIDFFDKPIVPRAEQDLAPGEQFGPYTSEVAKFLGRQFPESISPRRVDHLVRALGGGASSDLISAVEGIAGDERKKREGMSEFPVIGPGLFRRGGVEGTGSKTVERFYEELQRAKRESRSGLKVENSADKKYRDTLEDAAKAMKSLFLLRDLSEYGGITEKGQELQRLIKMIASDALKGKREPETRQAFKAVLSQGVEMSESRFRSMKRKEQIEALRRMNQEQRARMRGFIQPQ